MPTFRTFVRLPLPKTAGACRFGRSAFARFGQALISRPGRKLPPLRRSPMQRVRRQAERAAENRLILASGLQIPPAAPARRGRQAMLNSVAYEQRRNAAIWKAEFLLAWKERTR